MTVGLPHVVFVASGLFCAGAFAAAYRRDVLSMLAGVPLMLGGAAVLFAGVTRFAAIRLDPVSGQEFAAVLGVVALALVLLGRSWAREEGR